MDWDSIIKDAPLPAKIKRGIVEQTTKFTSIYLPMFPCKPHKQSPLKIGTTNMKGLQVKRQPLTWSKSGILTPRNQNFAWHRIDIHITQATPLENGNCKGEGTISWSGKATTKKHLLACYQESGFHVYHTNQPLGKRGLRWWRDYHLRHKNDHKKLKICVEPASRVSIHITQNTMKTTKFNGL